MSSFNINQYTKLFWDAVLAKEPIPFPFEISQTASVETKGTIRGHFDSRSGKVGVKFVDYNILSLLNSSILPVPRQLIDEATNYTRSSYDPSKMTSPMRDALNAQAMPDYEIPSVLNSDPEFHNAIQDAIDAFIPCQLRPIAIHSVNYPLSTAAGYGYTGNKESNRHLGLSKSNRLVTSFMEKGYDIEAATPYLSFTRTQLSDSPTGKTRLVWGAPLHSIMVSGTFLQPLYQSWLTYKTPTTFGSTIQDQIRIASDSVTQTGYDINGNDWCVMIADWPSFDTGKITPDGYSFGNQPFEDRIVMMIIAQAYKNYAYNVDLTSAMAIDLAYGCFKPIIIQGVRYHTFGMRPSGELGTYLKGSITNFIRLRYAQRKLFPNLRTSLIVGGDDSIQVIPNHPNPIRSYNEILKPWRSHLGPPPKSTVSRNLSEILFHGHTPIHRAPFRDELKVLCLALYPESDNVYQHRDDAIKSCSKLMSLYYDSGSYYHWLLAMVKIIQVKFSIHDDDLPLPSQFSKPIHELI